MPKVNLNDVDAWEGDGAGPTPDGSYKVKVEAIEERTGPKGEYWNLELKIADGSFAGRSLYDNLSFTDKSLGRLKQVLAALGVKMDGEFDLKPSMLKGKTAHVLVRREAYVNANGEDDTRPVCKAWAAKPFNANGSSSDGGSSLVDEATAKLGARPVDDDDIPF